MLVTETAYEAGMRLPSHSHGSSHLAILLEGSYLERTANGAYLCIPGDALHYQPDIHHENLFGRRVGRCLNLEFPEGETPSVCQLDRAYVPTEISSLIDSRGHVLPSNKHRIVTEARRRIDLFPAVSLGPLAESLFVHPSHLAKSFRNAFGMSVGQYAKLARIRSASRRLIETEHPIAEIAFDVGFFDQSHFSNTFAQVTGFTPAALRSIAQA